MSWLGGILSTFVGWVTSALLTWAQGLVQSALALAKQRSDTTTDAQQSTDPLKQATTPDEIDKATPGSLDGF